MSSKGNSKESLQNHFSGQDLYSEFAMESGSGYISECSSTSVDVKPIDGFLKRSIVNTTCVRSKSEKKTITQMTDGINIHEEKMEEMTETCIQALTIEMVHESIHDNIKAIENKTFTENINENKKEISETVDENANNIITQDCNLHENKNLDKLPKFDNEVKNEVQCKINKKSKEEKHHKRSKKQKFFVKTYLSGSDSEDEFVLLPNNKTQADEKRQLGKILCKQFDGKFDKYKKPNVSVLIGTTRFDCNMKELRSCSELFQKLSDTSSIRLPQKNVSETSFCLIYEWIITSRIDLNQKIILEIFEASNYLKIQVLIDQCWSWINREEGLKENIAFSAFIETKTFPKSTYLTELRKLLILRIHKYFINLMVSVNLKNLSESDLVMLLSSNEIAVHSEIEVFFTALRWLNEDWKVRKPFAYKVMRCVRFDLLPFWFLIYLVSELECPKIKRVIAIEDVKKFANKAMRYLHGKMFYEDAQSLKRYLHKNKLRKPDERRLLITTHKSKFPEFEKELRQSFNYGTFKNYMKLIQNYGEDYWQKLIFIDTKLIEE